MRPILYVVVNGSLEMSPGKAAAQVGHAVAGVMAVHPHPEWMKSPHRWLVVLEADDGLHLWNLYSYLRDRDVSSYLVIDEGVNEIPPMSATALGVEILDKDSPEASYLEGFRMYSYREPMVRAFKQGQRSRKWRYRAGSSFVVSDAKDWLRQIFPWF